jgi:hypothetical protein
VATGDAKKDNIKLGPGRLYTRIETHQPPPPPASLIYIVTKRGGEAVLRGGRRGIVILGDRRKP